ncbi:hypothetical protein ACOMHN_045509 [Nucella lapillus]
MRMKCLPIYILSFELKIHITEIMFSVFEVENGSVTLSMNRTKQVHPGFLWVSFLGDDRLNGEVIVTDARVNFPLKNIFTLLEDLALLKLLKNESRTI